MTSEKALRYTMVAMTTSVIYSLKGVSAVSCVPATSSMDMNMPVKITPIGLQAASRATGMPLKPVSGRL